jgi:ketosteroid isomerase-like protein
MEEQMKPRIAVSLVVLLLCTFVWGQTKTKDNTEQLIGQLEDQSRVAALKGDTTFMENYFANDFVRVLQDGSVVNRQQAIEMLKSGATKYSSIEMTNREIHTYPNAALVTATANVKGTVNGKSIDGQYRTSRMWVRQNGQWKVAAFQTTPIKP